MPKSVAYLRVSTVQQGKSGLGLEAQRAAIATFAQQHGHSIEAEYVEIETGKGHDALARAAPSKAAPRLVRIVRGRAAPRPVRFVHGRTVPRIVRVERNHTAPRLVRAGRS